MKTGQRRMVHLSIWASGQFSKLSMGARLTYIGMVTLGDDDGRLKADSRLLRSQLFPYDDDVKVSDVEKWMKEITDQKLTVEYEVEGERYMYHPKWEDYQLLRDDRRRESNIPPPLFEFESVATRRQPNDNQVATKRPPKISKEKLSKEKLIHTVEAEQAFMAFWSSYPKKIGKKAAWKAWQRIDYTPQLGARIASALEVAKKSDQWTKDSGRYIPHAATWVNGERWEDEVKTGPAKNSKYDHTNTKTVRG